MSAFYYDTTTPTPTFSWALAAGTLTISAEGISKMTMEKQGSPGEKIELDISGMSWTIDDDNGSDEFVGRMGTTASRAWGSAMPYFVYLINYDNTPGNVRMAISRDPTARVTPASTDGIGSNGGGAAATPAQTNFFVAYTNNTSLNSKPCQLIDVGLSAICDDSAGGIWTFTAPAAGDCLENTFSTMYTYPEGQGGASAGGYFSLAGAACTLDFATMYYIYTVSPSGMLELLFNTGNRSAGDAAATALYIHMPLSSSAGIGVYHSYAKVNNNFNLTTLVPAAASTYFTILATASNTPFTAANFANANDNIKSVRITCKVF